MHLDLFVTNFVVHESQPIVFGITETGDNAAIRVTKMPYQLFLEPALGQDDAEETPARQWLDKRLRPILDKNGHLSTFFRPTLQLVQRTKICGYAPSPTWMVRAMYDTHAALKQDAALVRKIFKDRCHVYHADLDPNLVFSAYTGIRCFQWIRCDEPAAALARLTTCTLEYACDVKRIHVNDPQLGDRPSPPLPLASFDIETDGLCWDRGDEIRMIGVSVADKDFLLTRHPMDQENVAYEILYCDSEAQLLQAFVTLINTLKPVFLTGWNIFRFDLQFLFERAKTLGVFSHVQKLSWLAAKPVRPMVKEMTSSAFGQNKVYHDDLQGLITLDGYILARKSTKRHSYSLKSFAEWIGDAKGDVSYPEMVDAFTTKDPAKLRRVADYCVQDAKLVPLILQRMEEPDKVMAMTSLAAVPPHYAIKRGQSILTFGLLLGEAFKRNLVINPPPKNADDQGGYQGATVIDPIRGYHNDPVAVLDFASLYPSIMRAYNICISTLVAVFKPGDDTSAYTFPDYSVIPIEDGSVVVFKRQGIEGVFPSVLRVLLAKRGDVRRHMKTLDPNSVAYAQGNAKQLALKVAANSMYGYLGASTSQLYEKALAACVTAMGRQSLFQVRRIIHDMAAAGDIPPKCHVVYGDSVVGDTPLLCRRDGRIFLVPISKLLTDKDKWAAGYHRGKESFSPAKPLEVWFEGGFTFVRRVIRHHTRKPILRVLTRTGMVDATSDHSLVSKVGQKTRPQDVERGDELLHSNDHLLVECLNKHHPTSSSSISKEEAFEMGVYEREIPDDMLTAPLDVIQAFWEGFDHRDGFYDKKTVAALYILAQRLGLAFSIDTYTPDGDLFTMRPMDPGDLFKDCVVTVTNISHQHRHGTHVYDLQTWSRHFGVAPGRLVVHNTDSVFAIFPDTEPQEAERHAHVIAKKCTESFPPPLELEFEYLFTSFLMENKKRYGARVYQSDPLAPPKTVIKGLSTERRDFPNLVKLGVQGILDILLNGGADAPDKALAFIERLFHDIATNTIPLHDLCATKELNKSSYVTPPPHLIVSQKMAARNPQDPPKPGDRITFLVLHGRGKISDRVDEFDFLKDKNPKVDLEYYCDLLYGQCEAMMKLCGKGHSYEAMGKKYIVQARLHCEGQPKLSTFFATAATAAAPTDTKDAPPPKSESDEIPAEEVEPQQQPPPCKKQTLMSSYFQKSE